MANLHSMYMHSLCIIHCVLYAVYTVCVQVFNVVKDFDIRILVMLKFFSLPFRVILNYSCENIFVLVGDSTVPAIMLSRMTGALT